MNEDSKPLPDGSLWGQLIYNGAAIGVLMGLLEVYRSYLLPSLFPNRHYILPTTTIGWFILIAIVIDVFFILAAVSILGVLVTAFRKLSRSERRFYHWSTLIRFVLITCVLSYQYIGLVHFYNLFKSAQAKLSATIIGILIIILISTTIVWLLRAMQRRLGKASVIILWIIAVVVLAGMIVPNYLDYLPDNAAKINLPIADIKQPPNVVLVTLDTLRADHLGCYGNKIVQTPVLDGLAADSCVFEAAYAQAPLTTPSHCSIMTSVYAAQHGAFNVSAMKPGFTTIAEILQANGYETVAFVSALTVGSSYTGLHKGFDYYEDSLSPYTTILRHDELHLLLLPRSLMTLWGTVISGDIVSNRALAWLNKKKKSPFFCWLHYFDPHFPYEPPAPYDDMYNGKVDQNLPKALDRSRYAGEVTYVDSQLGRFIEALKRKGLYDNTLIIVTADHGEAFGEKHDEIVEYGHGKHLYDTTQHVPLIIKLPGNEGFKGRTKNIVQLIDLAPTMLDYLRIPFPDTFEGRSLLGALNGEPLSKAGVAYAECQRIAGGQRILASVRTRKNKYIHDYVREEHKLYEILVDPAEAANIYSRNPKLAKSCYQDILDVLGKPVETERITVDPRVLEQLKTLGYVDDAPNAEK